MNIDIIGSQMDLGAVRKGVDLGPLAIRHAGLKDGLLALGHTIHDIGDVIPNQPKETGDESRKYECEINGANERLYNLVFQSHQKKHFPIVLGGDHSIATGSIAASLEFCDDLVVIWIDAHGDFNDDHITPTGNMHGMPLSALCGYGPDSMIQYSNKRLLPENVYVIGVRDLDPLERIKIADSGIHVFSIQDVHRLGVTSVMKTIVANLHGRNIHLSFDMDSLEPTYAPGVGTPVQNGLDIREAYTICEMIAETKQLFSMEFVEVNPLLDEKNKTGILAAGLIQTSFTNLCSCNQSPNHPNT